MSKKTILFDIDRTLIDSSQLTHSIFVELSDLLKTSPEQLHDLLQEYVDTLEKYTDFDPHGLLSFISQRFDHDIEQLKHIFFDEKKFINAVYPDAHKVLSHFVKNHIVGVFSEGVEEWQKTKLKLSGLEHFFDPEHLYILRRKTSPESLQTIPKHATIIDDNPDVVSELEKWSGLSVIHLDRPKKSKDYRSLTLYSDAKNAFQKVITSLEQLIQE